MKLTIINSDGFEINIGEKSEMKLMEYPDLGTPLADIQSDKVPGRDGEVFHSSSIGARDITLKIEAGLPLYIISRSLVPGTEVTLIVNDKWTIKGHISGIREHNRPMRLAKPVIILVIRCFDPYFTKINGVKTAEFSNFGGGIFETGDYTCQRITLLNEGDIPCPVDVTMRPTSTMAPSGLFNTLDWNKGKPLYTGLVFKSGTGLAEPCFITTNVFSDRFFESYGVLKNSDYFLLPPGKTVLFAQNVVGSLSFDPKYLYVDGRDI